MIRCNCSYCGKFVWKYPSDIDKSKSGNVYCNKTCSAQDQDYGKLIELICTECGNTFNRFQSQISKAKTCSFSCRMKRTHRIHGGIGSPGSKKLYPRTFQLRKIVTQRKEREQLKDHYIIGLIGGHYGLVKKDIPKEIVNLKRKHLKLKRQIR